MPKEKNDKIEIFKNNQFINQIQEDNNIIHKNNPLVEYKKIPKYKIKIFILKIKGINLITKRIKIVKN